MDTGSAALQLSTTYLRLRPDSSVEAIPVDETFWPRIMSGQLGSFHNEYLVTSFTYEKDWGGWEKHPAGEEMVCLLSGSVTLVLEDEHGVRREVALEQDGSYVLVPRNTWHTAKVRKPSRILFITPGEGTQNRPV